MPIHDRLHRLLAVNVALGVLAALIVVAAILALDTGSLRTLMLRDPGGALALALLATGFAVTAAGAMIGGAVMSLGDEPGGGQGGGRRPALAKRPVRLPGRAI